MSENILIIGSSGQDGQVLQRLLQNKDVNIYKKNRDLITTPNGKQFDGKSPEILKHIFQRNKINEVFFLAAPNFSATQLSGNSILPEIRENVELFFRELLTILELIRKNTPSTKIFFASSALIFGVPDQIPQDEKTKLKPNEIYSMFKIMCHDTLVYYRDILGLFIVIGIFYPHESEFRKQNFLFSKIIDHARNVKNRQYFTLPIIDINFKREWNCAYQVMESSIKALRLDNPEIYVIGSGLQYSVAEVCHLAFSYFNLDFRDFVVKSDQSIVQRSSDLIANPKKLLNAIGFKPDGNVELLIKRTYHKLSPLGLF